MISFATAIQSTTEQLRKVSLKDVFHAIQHPKQETEARLRLLRTIRNIDTKQYRALKTQLPYLVCAIFNPPFRRTENFAYTQYFILDIDHISAKGLNLEQLRSDLQNDERVMMCFLSPGEDGLKVLFRLEERCYDAGKFSLFYKLFAKQFAAQHHIEQVIDSKTSDVTRACFVSMDPQAYFNENATAVTLNAYVDENNPMLMFDLKRELNKEEQKERQAALQQSAAECEKPYAKDVDADIMASIKAILEPEKKNSTTKPQAFVPEQLNMVIDGLVAHIQSTGLVVYDVTNIQYAKKIRVRAQLRQAEVNLFYGKRGFSVVISPRTGTDAELNEMLSELVKQYLKL